MELVIMWAMFPWASCFNSTVPSVISFGLLLTVPMDMAVTSKALMLGAIFLVVREHWQIQRGSEGWSHFLYEKFIMLNLHTKNIQRIFFTSWILTCTDWYMYSLNTVLQVFSACIHCPLCSREYQNREKFNRVNLTQSCKYCRF